MEVGPIGIGALYGFLFWAYWTTDPDGDLVSTRAAMADCGCGPPPPSQDLRFVRMLKTDLRQPRY